MTSSKGQDITSLFLAVGSPALITYSLMLTVLNSKWTRDEFGRLHRCLSDVTPRYPAMKAKLHAIEYVLNQSQQVPLRLSQELGWLSSLIVNGRNDPWWENVARDLSFTRRKVTLSLVIQMLVAAVAWAMSVSVLFITNIGDLISTEQIAAGNVWVWMIPVIWGWLLAGTQTKRKSIDIALTHRPASRAGSLAQESSAAGHLEHASAGNAPCAVVPSADGPASIESLVQRGL